MGSQNWWCGDPRTLLYRVKPLHIGGSNDSQGKIFNEFRGFTEFIPTHSGKSVRSKWPGAEGFGRIAVDENIETEKPEFVFFNINIELKFRYGISILNTGILSILNNGIFNFYL